MGQGGNYVANLDPKTGERKSYSIPGGVKDGDKLGKTVREVRNLFATSASLQATLDMRQSDLTKANEDLARRAAHVLRLNGDDDDVGASRRGRFDGRECRDAEACRHRRPRIGVEIDDRQRLRCMAARDQASQERPRHVAAADEGNVQGFILD